MEYSVADLCVRNVRAHDGFTRAQCTSPGGEYLLSVRRNLLFDLCCLLAYHWNYFVSRIAVFNAHMLCFEFHLTCSSPNASITYTSPCMCVLYVSMCMFAVWRRAEHQAMGAAQWRRRRRRRRLAGEGEREQLAECGAAGDETIVCGTRRT